MSGKALSKDCCCGGCSSVPAEEQNAGFLNFHPTQQYCCACVPNYLCLTYYCGTGTPAYVLLTLTQCVIVEHVTNAYSGKIVINGVEEDVLVSLDVVDTQCYICLYIPALGLGGTGTGSEYCVLLTDSIRSTLCTACQDCPEPSDPAIITWTLPSSGCTGTGNATVELARVPVTSLYPTMPLISTCVDPCLDTGTGAGCDGGFSLTSICTGCDCVCNTARLTVYKNTRREIQETRGVITPLGTGTGTSINPYFDFIQAGFIVDFVANGITGNCEMRLTARDITFTSSVENVPLSNSAYPVGKCPTPYARWDFTAVSGTGTGGVEEEYSIVFFCDNCDDHCLTCDCICSKACLLLVAGSNPSITETVQLCGNSYLMSTGYSVEVYTDPYSRDCYLKLNVPDSVDPNPVPAPILIDSVNNPCPNPVAVWRFLDNNQPPLQDYVVFSFSCMLCGGECQTVDTEGCCDVPLPLVLNASLTATSCVGCETFNIVLVWDHVLGVWYGQATLDCDLGEVILQLSCGGAGTATGSHQEFTLLLMSTCIPSETQIASGLCDPINLAFTFIGPFALGCCGDIINPADPIGVVITE